MRTTTVVEIPLEAIKPDPTNLRRTFDADDIRSLAENIQQHGQMDPIQVFTTGQGSYDLLDGERRWRAARLAGLSHLKALVVPRPTEVDLLCKKISRFMQTRNLAFPEEVKALEEGLQALGVLHDPDKWQNAAPKLGVRPGVLAERMRVARLAPDLRKQFEEGKLDYTNSQAIGRIPDHKLQRKVAEFVSKEQVSNRFVMTRLVPEILENPNQSVIESYDRAKMRERFRYASPRKKEEIPTHIEERIDELLSDFRKCIRWMEAAGNQNLIAHLGAQNFNTRRVLTTLRHLQAMVSSFVSAYRQVHGDSEIVSASKQPKLTGTQRLLEEFTDTGEKEDT